MYILKKSLNAYFKGQRETLAIVLFLAGIHTLAIAQPGTGDTLIRATGNPIIRHVYTTDPAAMAYNGKGYLYTGHDEAPPDENRYVMNDWLCFSSSDMVNWTQHPSPMNVKIFSWAKADAWASQVIERNERFYWYVSIEHSKGGKAIGVAVSGSPTGPFKDALSSALVTNDMTTATNILWDDIDPSVIIDNDGQAYLLGGNTVCYYAKLKKSMTEFEGPIHPITSLPHYTEAPWIHKRNGWYYLSYAYEFPEKIAYAMSRNINGPWQFKGILNELAGNSNTDHQSIIDFRGKSYFIYHNGALAANAGGFHRSVCIDYLYYNSDGTIKRVIMTTEGVKPAP